MRLWHALAEHVFRAVNRRGGDEEMVNRGEQGAIAMTVEFQQPGRGQPESSSSSGGGTRLSRRRTAAPLPFRVGSARGRNRGLAKAAAAGFRRLCVRRLPLPALFDCLGDIARVDLAVPSRP